MHDRLIDRWCIFISFLYKMLYRLAVASKKFILPLLPKSVGPRIKKKLLSRAFPLSNDINDRISKKNFQTTQLTKGVNLVGYARAEMGIGESCRLAARSLNSVDVPFGIINFEGTNSARMNDQSWIHKEINKPIYDVNIFHINAEQMLEVYAQYGNSVFLNKYNIGYWHWELPDFPDEWLDGFKFVNEVWVPSNFVANSIALKSPVPVVRIPHGIEVLIKVKRERSYFNLPNDAFLFLSMYDVKSYQARKNPRASIEAFKLSFKPDDRGVGLVIKINNALSNLQELQAIYDLIDGYNNIYIIKETLDRDETNALIDITDCYISLHRSEGFGLGLAEGMYLGKPVIGTNWSSNTDFMENNNSCLVNYNLVKVGKDHGPYKSYQYWAEPDIEHASYFMKTLVSDKSYYRQIAINGQKNIKENYSPAAVGQLMTKRLKYLNLY
ncbi:glycosyltransferase [Paenibacillus ferrarius]|uniref:glycosyltransferase n=1 Tax=Paenibacillus ferrarius TaxID=1469647 RepID=UPI003D2D06F4